MAMVDEGVSARGNQRLTGRALSSSEVSRQWVKHSAQRIEELRGKDLSEDEYFGLMMDGVFLKEMVVLVALGIKKDESKEVLDFSVGSSESYKVARFLCSRLQEHRFNVKGRLLAVLDGARPPQGGWRVLVRCSGSGLHHSQGAQPPRVSAQE